MEGAEQISTPRSLELRALTDYEDNIQFEGNGTAAYPPLYNRDVFAFLPFQVNAHRFVIPIYVMTRNVDELYKPSAAMSDPTRFDLPPERYGMKIGGVDGSEALVSATDPLTGETIPVDVISRSEDEIVVEMPVTDSPRLLTIEEDESSTPPPVDPRADGRRAGARRTRPRRARTRGARPEESGSRSRQTKGRLPKHRPPKQAPSGKRGGDQSSDENDDRRRG